MSRGSVASWQSYARRRSEGMLQFTPGEDFEHRRGGGWFLTYAKAGCIVAAFVVGIILAGLLGSYIGSSPKRKVHDPVDLVTDEVEDTDVVARTSVIPHVRPARYRLELTPVIELDVPTKIKGRAVIEFHVDASVCLNELPLDAINVDATSWKLSLKVPGRNEDAKKRRRRREAEEESDNSSGVEKIIESDTTKEGVVDSTITSSDLEYRNVTHDIDYPLGNATSRDDETTRLSSINDDRSTDVNRNVSGIVDVGKAQKFDDASRPRVNDRNDADVSMSIDIKDYEIDAINGIHVVKLASCIGRGSYILEIDYEVPVDGRAIYVANFTEQQRWLMGTRLKPVGVRRLMPVFDDVKFKSVFSVSISRPEETTVLSNMPLMTSETTSDNWTIDTFEEISLVPNNFAFTMGYVDTVNETESTDAKVPVKFWFGFERQTEEIYIRDKVHPILANLIEVFQVPYPFPKLDMVVLPIGIGSDRSSPGLISVRNLYFHLTNRSPIVTRVGILKAFVHLLGEQWLGGIVNMNSRMDTWVLEGALLCLEHEMLRKLDSSLDSSHSFVADVQAEAMDMDSYSISRPLQVKVGHPYFDAWSMDDQDRKGACLIRMLHGAIGSTAFRNGYEKFIKRWENETADLDGFLNTMEKETEELQDIGSLKTMMNSWITQGGYPVVIVTRNYEEGTASIVQKRFAYDERLASTKEPWHIELTYISDQDDWSNPRKIWLKSREMKLANVSLPGEHSWVLFNVNKMGYYRVHYDSNNWKLLSQALTHDHEIFTPETRASLVDDVLSLAAVGLLRYETAFDFIKYMQMKERHYAPWQVLMRHAFRLNNALYMTPAFTDFQDVMAEFVIPLYEDVGSKLEEGSQLTFTAVQLACFFDHFKCLSWAHESFDKLRNDTESLNVIPGYIRETIYCVTARHGSREEWTYLLNKIRTTKDKEEKDRLLSSFACFQVPWILEDILNEVLYGTTYSMDEIQVILRQFPKNPSAAQVAYRFVRGNWADIVERYSSSYTVMKSFVVATTNGLTNQQDVQDLLLFREYNFDSMKAVRYAAAIVEAKANFTMSWLGHHLAYIREWLLDRKK